MAQFILMLTDNDRTVPHALASYRDIADTGLACVGFKDIGLSMHDMAALVREIHRHGRQAMLEVVSTTREEELASVRAARELGVDYLLGGRHAQEAVSLLQGSGIRYFPFCGHAVGHPTRLLGSIEEIVDDARRLAGMPGVDGIDLLAYRFSGDVAALLRGVVDAVGVPVIAAGSIDCPERIHTVCDAGVWGFTIGSALFHRRFLHDNEDRYDVLRKQVEAVLAIAASGHAAKRD